jgi:heme A synthase
VDGPGGDRRACPQRRDRDRVRGTCAAWALFRLRSRKDLLYGAIVLVVLLVLEGYLGGLIRDEGKDSLTPIHIPLPMFLMAVSVWLPLRAARGASGR